MQSSKNYLQNKNISPYISFQDGKAHTVTLLADEDYTLMDKEGIRFTVLENGEEKTFFTTSISLIRQLAEFSENTIVTIQLKTKIVNGNPVKSYDVSVVGTATKKEEIEIPVIEDEGKQAIY